MGSFNTSCFASKQTIGADAACVITPITQAHSYRPISYQGRDGVADVYGHTHSTCYPDRFWRPVGASLVGQCNEYGQLSLHDTEGNRKRLPRFLADCLNDMPPVLAGENSYSEVPVDLHAFMREHAQALYGLLQAPPTAQDAPALSDELFAQAQACWEYLQDGAKHERLVWGDHLGAVRPLAFAVMHASAYAAFLAYTERQTDTPSQGHAPRAFFDKTLAEACAALEQRLADGAANRQFLLDYMSADIFRECLRGLGYHNGGRAPGEDAATAPAVVAYFKGEVTADQLFDTFKPWLVDRYVNDALSELNLHFEPMVYAAEDYFNDVGQRYARLVADVASSVTREQQAQAYGPFQTYGLVVSDTAVIPQLVAQASQMDTCLRVLHTEPYVGKRGDTLVMFETPMEFGEVGELVACINADAEAGLELVRAGTLFEGGPDA